MDDAQVGEEPGEAAAVEEHPRPQYVVSLALQRGPYPYEARTSVVAALDAATEAEEPSDDWQKAMRRALKEGGEVRVVRISLDAERVVSLFDGRAEPPSFFQDTAYVVRLALVDDQPPVVVAALDQEMAESMGINLAGSLQSMPMFYRRQVAKAPGDLREILLSIPREAVDVAFAPKPIAAQIERLLTGDDPRF